MSKRNNSALANVIEADVADVINVTEGGEGKGRRKYDVESLKVEAKEVLGDTVGVSNQIRKLSAVGWERGKIAVALNKRYQHVRNVLTQPLKTKD